MKRNDYLEVLWRLRCPTPKIFHKVAMPDKSEEWARGCLADLKRAGLAYSSELPLHPGQVFYLISNKGCRRINRRSKFTTPQDFKPRTFFNLWGMLNYGTEFVIEPGIEVRPIMRPSDFERGYPELAGAPHKYFAVDPDGAFHALQVIALPSSRRVITKAHSRFRIYAQNPAWQELIIQGLFRYVIIVPSEGKKESIQAELNIQAIRRHKSRSSGKADKAFHQLFEDCLVVWPCNDLAQFI